ncbi:MAG: hypothetical protein UT66_C0028G0032 [candidate division CPR2 bacterium GW2011_GWC1_39_9]|uniref:Phosphoribosyltransferase domain-containing protein n=1 Tax=candidate division CPR2 bacterium GW2011_GWC2_39_10 TaxID=1618345 RepID=A0A0G0LUU6_UNCC2|nr:MAG: hypothetical protein UT18_C0007G0058 [candidate division CPR2 bacterium GW2011_GWC2_39_10]KKR34141.1 MAG: hypothetical protein UT66_C0028G0032 [candidate division CPR2 bacterium GW2011_GWC1_39_9]
MEAFIDRKDAGSRLAVEMNDYITRDSIVIALPRGGVVVGYKIAKKYGLPLDVFISRKIRHPFNPEYAIGAITETGHMLKDEQSISSFYITGEYLEKTINEEKKLIADKINIFRGGKPLSNLNSKDIILVDDGIATGYSITAAIESLRQLKVASIVLVVPVAPLDAIERLTKLVNKLFVLLSPPYFTAVGEFYSDFSEVTDNDVVEILSKSKRP